MATATRMTADEFREAPSNGRRTELVRGRPVERDWSDARRAYVVGVVARHLNAYVLPRRLGAVLGGGCGVVTSRDPDTFRGADAAFFTAGPDPRELLTPRYPTRPPLVIFEVRSPRDHPGEPFAKAGEYLQAGVAVVVGSTRRGGRPSSSPGPTRSTPSPRPTSCRSPRRSTGCG